MKTLTETGAAAGDGKTCCWGIEMIRDGERREVRGEDGEPFRWESLSFAQNWYWLMREKPWFRLEFPGYEARFYMVPPEPEPPKSPLAEAKAAAARWEAARQASLAAYVEWQAAERAAMLANA